MKGKGVDILWLIIGILLVLWLLGAVVVPVGGSLIHLLLVVVAIIVLVRLLRGERL